MKRKIKYRCQHISCRNPQCYEGEFSIENDILVALKEAEVEPNAMRSPAGTCKIGTSQVFEILDESDGKPETVEERTSYTKEKIAEMNKIRKRLLKEKAEIDQQVKKAEKNLRALNSRLRKLEAEEK